MARAFKESEDLQAAVEQLPYMSGSGFAGDRVRVPGYVFCMRMGAAPLPWFRWVPVDEAWVPVVDPASGEAAVVDDTLVSLMNADPGGPLTPREVSDEAFAGAYAAWEARSLPRAPRVGGTHRPEGARAGATQGLQRRHRAGDGTGRAADGARRPVRPHTQVEHAPSGARRA